MSGSVLNISTDIQTYSTTFQGNFFLCLTTFTIFFSLVIRWNFICFNLCLLLLTLSVSTTERSLTPLLLLFPIRYFYSLIRFSHVRLNSPSSASPHTKYVVVPWLSLQLFTERSPFRGVAVDGTDVPHSVLLENEAAEKS